MDSARERGGTVSNLGLSGQDRQALLHGVILSLGMALLVLSVPVFMLQLYDRIIPSGNLDTLFVLTAIAMALLALFGLFDNLRAGVLHRLGVALELRALERAPLAALGSGDLDRLRLACQSGVPAALLDLPAMPVFLIVLAILHPWLAVLALAMAGLLLAVSGLSGGRPLLRATGGAALDAALDGSERQWLSPLQATAIDGLSERRAEQRLGDLADLDRRSRRAALLKSLRLAAQIACLALGGLLAIQGALAPAAIVAATIVMSRALAPIEQLAGGWAVWREGWQAWQRLRRLLPEDAAPAGMPPESSPEIRFEQAVIAPPGSDRPLLRGIDLTLLPGTWLGIVGSSGTGKTALLRTIAGQWPTRFGRVQTGGRDPRDLDPARHRALIGMVEQQPRLLAGSIAENIAGFRKDARAEAIVAAARAAGIHQAVLAEPDGYGREVGPQGRHLTLALRTGVALAAALYDEPAILLLDAPFDGLDMAHAARLAQTLARWQQADRLVIVTAHRLEDVAQASHLLVLGEGRIQAGGRRQDVLGWLDQRQRGGIASLPANQPGRRPRNPTTAMSRPGAAG